MSLKKVSKARKVVNGLRKIGYNDYYEKLPIDEYAIFLEPQQGRTINGNIFYIVKELSNNELYKDYKVYVVLEKDRIDNCKKVLEKNNIKNVKIVTRLSRQYYKLMASAKYLMTDTAFNLCYIKKEGQVILNTWHGTPLKCLGRQSKNDYFNIGNVQKNFIISDYLLYPNEYTRDHMIKDYMVDNLSKANVMLLGYPRNTAFFDNELRNNIREELGLENKEVLVYMPTWREYSTEEEALHNKKVLNDNLKSFENELKDNQVMYVNLHPLDVSGVDFSNFKKIKTFSKEYETYQFLNIADTLITDYSSVFFDFAITKRRIVLFCYDKNNYLKTRGMYFDYNDLPFEKAETVKELFKILDKKNNVKYDSFLKKFCNYEREDACKLLCEKIILNRKNNVKIEQVPNNNKNNVLIYTGNLAKNGITSSLMSLLNLIDRKERNYYLTFVSGKIMDNKEVLLNLPDNINYIATNENTNLSILQRIKFKSFFKNKISTNKIEKDIKEVFSKEIKRLYGDAKFSDVIQFNGYENKKILLYSVFDSNKIIYVHSNMLDEIKTRNTQHRKTIEYAYSNYDKVAVVSDLLFDSTKQINNNKDNVFLAKNTIDYKSIIEKSKKEIEFDSDTVCNVSLEKLKKVLDSKKKKIITIGRFSKEKGHKRLINSFNKIYKNKKDTYLIIVGGHGNLYDETLELVNSLECKNNVILIKKVSNPYNILKKCDYFILSSFYEGFGLVIAEADILGLPVVSTDIEGPKKFMDENHGVMVENSEEGIYEGLKLLLDNKVKVMNVDYEKYNKEAIEEFYSLLR